MGLEENLMKNFTGYEKVETSKIYLEKSKKLKRKPFVCLACEKQYGYCPNEEIDLPAYEPMIVCYWIAESNKLAEIGRMWCDGLLIGRKKK